MVDGGILCVLSRPMHTYSLSRFKRGLGLSPLPIDTIAVLPVLHVFMGMGTGKHA